MSDYCEAQVSRGYHRTRCNKRAEQARGGHKVCGTHASQYDRWVGEGRNMVTMTNFWWGWADRG